MHHLVLLALFAAPPLVAEPIVDRGEVRIGPPLFQTFSLVNRTDQPIRITDVRTTCGCLAPRLDRRELAPGQSTPLIVEINTLSQPAGPIAWTIRLLTDIGEQTLTVRATLISEIRVEPAALGFQIRQPRSVTVTVTDTRATPFRVTAAGATSPRLSVEVLSGANRQTTLLRVTATAAASSTETVWFTTDDPRYPQVRIPVTLTVADRVSASPAAVTLKGGDSALVQLNDRDGAAVIVDRVDIEGPLVARFAAGPGTRSTVRLGIDRSKCDGQPTTAKATVYLREPAGEKVVVAVEIR